MIKRITLRIDTEVDAAVVEFLESIPAGERNARICAALRYAFGGRAPDLVSAINRLATAIEGHGGLPISPAVDSRQPAKRTDPEFRAKLKQSVLGAFEK